MRPRNYDPRWHSFTKAVRELRSSPEDDVAIAEIARLLRWDYAEAQGVAARMTEERLIETDMGMGWLPTVVEAPDHG